MRPDSPKISNLADLFAAAYRIETDAVERYALLADQMETHNNAELAAMFRDLARAEGLHAEEIRGKEVLLVDDVYTTGTTVSECARVLRRAGAAKVWVATVARTMKEPSFKVSTLQGLKDDLAEDVETLKL